MLSGKGCYRQPFLLPSLVHRPARYYDLSMTNKAPRVRASDLLLNTLKDWPNEQINIGEISQALGERAFGVVMLLFALPNCIPFPPGVNSIFGLPLLFCAAQLLRGRGVPWQPQFVARRSFKRETLVNAIEKVKPKIARFEKLFAPRLPVFVGDVAEKVLALFVCIFSLCIMIPLPGTNMIPGIGCALIAVALIERDGLLAIIGTVIGTLGSILTIGIVGGFIAGMKLVF